MYPTLQSKLAEQMQNTQPPRVLCGEIKREPQMSKKLSVLSNDIDKLENNIKLLKDKLQPLTIQEPCKNECGVDSAPPPECLASIPSILNDMSSRLYRVNRDIDTLLNTVEL